MTVQRNSWRELFATVTIALIAVVIAACSAAHSAERMRSARNSFCGSCAASMRNGLLTDGILLVPFWLTAWPVTREIAPRAARSVAMCGIASILGWAIAVAEAYRLLADYY